MSTRRVVYVKDHSEHLNLEDMLGDGYKIITVHADEKGDILHHGKFIPDSFFDHHADVVVTSLNPELHKKISDTLPHIPVVGLHSYTGMYSGGKHRDVWQEHAKNKGIQIPHSTKIHHENVPSMHDIRHKVFLPSMAHSSSLPASQRINTFPELADLASSLTAPLYIEREVKGSKVYITSIRDFRDNDIYTTPLLYKTQHGYEVCTHVNESQKEDAIRYTKELHEELGLGPVAQFEFVIDKGNLYLVNMEPNPSHAENEALHQGLVSVGSSMKELWKHIIENAKRKK
jgi:hypothetical protein